MIPAFLRKPRPTPIVDSGYSWTVIPDVPFTGFDGGDSKGTSNPPMDGGNSSYVPIKDA